MALLSLVSGCGAPLVTTTEHRAARSTEPIESPLGFALASIVGWHAQADASVAARLDRDDGRAGGIVTVEPMAGVELEQSSRLALATLPAPYQLVSTEALSFAGHDAIRQVARATIENAPMRFDQIVFLDHDRGYRLLAWGDAVDAFFGAFTLAPITVVEPSPTPATSGRDWRIVDGILQSAAGDLAIECPSGWRFLTGAELWQSSPDAVAGLHLPRLGLRLVVLAERTPERAQRSIVAMMHEHAGTTLGEAIDFTSLTFVRAPISLTSHRQGGFEYLHGVRCEGALCRQILAWYPQGVSDAARRALAELPPIRELESSEREALAALPGGFEQHATRFEDRTRGLYGSIASGDVEQSNSAYHAIARTAAGLPALVGEPQSLGDLLLSDGEREMQFGRYRFMLATGVRDGHASRVLIWGWPEDVNAARAQIETFLGAQ